MTDDGLNWDFVFGDRLAKRSRIYKNIIESESRDISDVVFVSMSW